LTDAKSDHELMYDIAQGNHAAYRVLLERHIHRLVRMGERMVGNRQDAEDIAQEVSLKVWHEAPRWKPQAQFSTWLYRVMMNACIDVIRKKVPQQTIEDEVLYDETPSVHEVIELHQQAQRVRVAMGQLPDRQRAAVVLSYYEALDNQTSADTMGMSLGAFQQLLFRAKKQLRDELNNEVKEQHYG
jgi:RNA polymerase sigma-70 factor (ECF subfamily)